MEIWRDFEASFMEYYPEYFFPWKKSPFYSVYLSPYTRNSNRRFEISPTYLLMYSHKTSPFHPILIHFPCFFVYQCSSMFIHVPCFFINFPRFFSMLPSGFSTGLQAHGQRPVLRAAHRRRGDDLRRFAHRDPAEASSHGTPWYPQELAGCFISLMSQIPVDWNRGLC